MTKVQVEQIVEALAINTQWAALLPAIFAAGEAGYAAFKNIVAALKSQGVEADVVLLEKVIAEAASRKQREDDILGGSPQA